VLVCVFGVGVVAGVCYCLWLVCVVRVVVVVVVVVDVVVQG
jgi:hypothetical protein